MICMLLWNSLIKVSLAEIAIVGDIDLRWIALSKPLSKASHPSVGYVCSFSQLGCLVLHNWEALLDRTMRPIILPVGTTGIIKGRGLVRGFLRAITTGPMHSLEFIWQTRPIREIGTAGFFRLFPLERLLLFMLTRMAPIWWPSVFLVARLPLP